MEFRQCKACRQPFRRRPQNPDQCFCSADACQRERRRRWQAAKRQSDPDYRENQKRAQKAWAERHPDYWRAYREQHPEYVARNRARQRERALAPAGVAKMDASKRGNFFALRHLPFVTGGGRVVCKDGRVDGRNHRYFSRLRLALRPLPQLAKRGLDRLAAVASLGWML
jgi:hypothetical protein